MLKEVLLLERVARGEPGVHSPVDSAPDACWDRSEGKIGGRPVHPPRCRV